MTWTAAALVVVLAWFTVSAVIAMGLGSLVARNGTALPKSAPRTVEVSRPRVTAHAA